MDVLNTRTTFQINREFALRAIVQYDSSKKQVLTDFLGSWELLPGTVAYAGYGSLIEERGWNGSEWTDAPPCPTARRSAASSSRPPTSTASDDAPPGSGVAGDGNGQRTAHRAHLLDREASDVAGEAGLLDGLHVVEVDGGRMLEAFRDPDRHLARAPRKST